MHRRAFLIGLCVVAVAARLATGAVLLTQGAPAFVLSSDDGDAYDAAARSQAFGAPIVMTDRMSGKWDTQTPLEARWPQGYWLLLAAQYRLFGSAYASTLVVQALLAAAGVLAVYALATRVFGEAVARVAGVGQALSSTGVYLSSALYAEALYLPMLLVGVALAALAVEVARGGRARWLWAAAGGAAFGVAEATRPLALPVFGAAAIWAGFLSSSPWFQRLRILVALGMGFCLALLPFVVHDLSTLGRIAVFTAGGAEALRDQTVHGDVLVDRILTMFITGGWAPLGEPLISSPGALPTLLGRLAEWILAAIGAAWLLVGNWRRAKTRVGWLLVLAAAAVVGPSLLVGLPLVRYRAAADPLFIIFMIAGVIALWYARAQLNRSSPRGSE